MRIFHIQIAFYVPYIQETVQTRRSNIKINQFNYIHSSICAFFWWWNSMKSINIQTIICNKSIKTSRFLSIGSFFMKSIPKIGNFHPHRHHQNWNDEIAIWWVIFPHFAEFNLETLKWACSQALKWATFCEFKKLWSFEIIFENTIFRTIKASTLLIFALFVMNNSPYYTTFSLHLQ